MSINRVTLSGNLTRDPEVRMAGSTPVCEFGLAVNERKKDQSGEWVDVPNFFDVVMWGARGESVAKYLSKGDKVMIAGRLRWRQWESDGQKRSKVEVVAEDIEFGSKAGQKNDSPTTNAEVFGSEIPF